MTTPQKIAQYLATADARRSDVDNGEFYRPASASYKKKAKSPSKVIKSKVAGNMKSIKKSQTRAMLQQYDLGYHNVDS